MYQEHVEVYRKTLNNFRCLFSIGGEELKATKMAQISKQDALIGNTALDAVFDSWTCGEQA
jgi:hypothetical protein